MAVVLAPVVRPDLFGPPVRALTTQEQALVSPYVSLSTAAGGGVAAFPKPATPGAVAQAGFGGPVGWILGLGLLGAFLVRPKRRGR